MASSTLMRTTIRLSPSSLDMLKKKSILTKNSIQKLIEEAVVQTYSKTHKPKAKKTGSHNFDLGIKKGATFSRDEIYSYLDEKF